MAIVEIMSHEGEKLRSLAAVLMEAPDDAEVVDQFFRQLYTFAQVDPRRLGGIAHAGRTLGALNDPTSAMNKFITQFHDILGNLKGRSPKDIANHIASLRTLQEMQNYTKNLSKPGFWKIAGEVWINARLSGITTHMRNFISNTNFALWQIPERAVAGKFGKAGPGQVKSREALEMVYGYYGSLGDAWITAKKAFREDAPQFGSSRFEARTTYISSEALEMTGSAGKSIDLLGNFIRAPGRFLQAGDEFFKAMTFRGELRARAYREAYDRVVFGQGLDAKEATEQIYRTMDEIMQDIPADIVKQAEEFAHYATFTKELQGFGAKVQAAAREHTAVRFIAPFVRTPVNIFEAGIERTPIGLLSHVKGATGAQRQLAQGRVALGTGTMGMVSLLTMSGLVSGTGPKDSKTRNEWREAGWQPLSMRVPLPGGGKSAWMGYGAIEPLSNVVGLAADLSDILGAIDSEDIATFETVGAVITEVGASLSKLFTSKTFVRGVADWTAWIMDPDRHPNTPERFAAGFIPFSGLLGQLAKAHNNELKHAETLVDQIYRTIPGLNSKLLPVRNLFGEKVKTGSGFDGMFGMLFNAVSPVQVSRAPNPDTALIYKNLIGIQERLGESISTGIPRVIEGIEMSPEMRDFYGQQMGKVGLKEELLAMMKDPLWNSTPTYEQFLEVQTVINAARTEVAEMTVEEFPELEKDIEQRLIDREEV